MTRRKRLRIIVLGGAGLFVGIYALLGLSPRWTSGDDKPTASVTEAVPSVTLVLTYRGTDAYEGIRIDADNNSSVCGSPTQERLGRLNRKTSPTEGSAQVTRSALMALEVARSPSPRSAMAVPHAAMAPDGPAPGAWA